MTVQLRLALASSLLVAGCRSTPSPPPAPSALGESERLVAAAASASTNSRSEDSAMLVKRLMDGRLDAATFPAAATDVGRPYDAELYNRLTTVRVQSEVQVSPGRATSNTKTRR